MKAICQLVRIYLSLCGLIGVLDGLNPTPIKRTCRKDAFGSGKHKWSEQSRGRWRYARSIGGAARPDGVG